MASAGLGELLLIGPEGFFVDRLKGECGLIVDPAVAFDGVARSALEAMGHQSPSLGERMIGGCGDLGQRNSLILPGDNVSGRGDLDVGAISAPLDLPRIVDFEQFRMQRSAVKLENQFGDFGAN